MELALDILADAARDTLTLVPFLFVTYFLLEALDHAAAGRVARVVGAAGAAGPVVGAALGVAPQCGFSAMGATLWAGRVITLGTLVAVFLSTSDEMLPLLVAERADFGQLLQILGTKALVAVACGLAVDAGLRAWRRVRRHGKVAAPRSQLDEIAESGEGAHHVHDLCEHDHCGCDDHGGHDDRGMAAHVLRAAVSHTVQVTLFVFVVTLALVAVLETVGADALAQLLAGNQLAATLVASLVGLVPNCAASVVITQLYLEGALGFGPMMAGSLVSAGTGFLVLFRANERPGENVAILGLLVFVGASFGLACLALGVG